MYSGKDKTEVNTMPNNKKQEPDDKTGVLETSDAALVAYLNNGNASLMDSPVSSISSLISEINLTDEDNEEDR